MREWEVPGYTEVRVLGSGGFGEVVLARHDKSSALVAVKYLRSGLLDDAEFARLFRAEARVLASLDDPNVVRLYEYVESPSGAAIVMELVDGVLVAEDLVPGGQDQRGGGAGGVAGVAAWFGGGACARGSAP